MQALLIVLSAATLSFWLLWWMTFRALRRAQRLIIQKQSRIETQLEFIDVLVDRAYGTRDELPDPNLRQAARREVRRILEAQ
ncbi:MAG: hypothetical protein R3200_07210 [Xanthomonadales bacterium]|nr:hypothetical protein [Xanthomonadales bacterium]